MTEQHIYRAPADQFRDGMESAVEHAVARLPEEIVTALWNALDDERGRLVEENRELHTEIEKITRWRREDRAEAGRLVRSFIPRSLDDGEARAVAHALRLAAEAVERGHR